MSRPPVRRVVTGHDDAGRAIILSDGPAPNSFESAAIPGFGATVPWWTKAEPIDHVTDRDPATAEAEIPSFPGPGETILRIADFPPDSVYPDEADTVIFTELDGHEEADAGTTHSARKHFWFHRTDSLDYAVVLDGEITLLVDDGETTLGAGDVVIQRATSHAWSNRTDRTARMLFVLVGTPPQSAAAIAEQRRSLTTVVQAP
ncbi:cupin domain-containing protein [Kocuria marina]|uniref:cupin domain-containing protein n=1 Tax=Kocuria marina TaxID=223184 RepID=UPI003F2151B1